jgi:hypothetical protein
MRTPATYVILLQKCGVHIGRHIEEGVAQTQDASDHFLSRLSEGRILKMFTL